MTRDNSLVKSDQCLRLTPKAAITDTCSTDAIQVAPYKILSSSHNPEVPPFTIQALTNASESWRGKQRAIFKNITKGTSQTQLDVFMGLIWHMARHNERVKTAFVLTHDHISAMQTAEACQTLCVNYTIEKRS